MNSPMGSKSQKINQDTVVTLRQKREGDGFRRTLLLHIVCVCSVTQSCPALCSSKDLRSPSGSSVHGIFQARILEWVAISFSRRSSPPRDWTHVSCIVSKLFIDWATREAHCTVLINFISYFKMSEETNKCALKSLTALDHTEHCK